MNGRTVFLDASFFLGMHAADPAHRRRSLAYFTRHLADRPRMTYEQIGICDAVIWGQDRHTQDLYYPFMDRLHTDMAIQRGGYTYSEIRAALEHHDLIQLPPETALLAAQVLYHEALLATHDRALLALPSLQGRIIDLGQNAEPVEFPEPLRTLYDESTVFVYDEQH